MQQSQNIINQLLQCIQLEEKAQADKFTLANGSLKQLKASGVVLHPIHIINKTFGYADYPECTFGIVFPPESNYFKDGAAIELFYDNEPPVKGILLHLNGVKGELRLFAPDYPDWLEQRGVGIKLAPDTYTTNIMKTAVKNIADNKALQPLFNTIYAAGQNQLNNTQGFNVPVKLPHHNLNASQKTAVANVLANPNVCIIHGPPGTGKTTTLVAAVQELAGYGNKVLVSAPSNTAVDHFALCLLNAGITILRVGNVAKVNTQIYAHTPEGKQSQGQTKEVKQLKKRADEMRRLALSYKRKFGKAEREQRSLLFKEVKSIRNEILAVQNYNEEKMYQQAQVILGTPVGLQTDLIKKINFDTLIIDEAGQCLEPLAWAILPLAKRWVLAGDHLQLPPTVLSVEAAKKGFNTSILEKVVPHFSSTMLNIQYRMQSTIAGFSSNYFYNNQLQSATHLQSTTPAIHFIDTAGTGYQETTGADGSSLTNIGEIEIIQALITQIPLITKNVAVISPYSGQVQAVTNALKNIARISTIDSFQGQEEEVVILSLVRSNPDGVIGFLNDYRRMNVAITRAKSQLYIIGDSATLGNDKFYNSLLTYIETNGNYRTAWEFLTID
jgi:ATP-dependent RNA/DNA helicase IGHMBP2